MEIRRILCSIIIGDMSQVIFFSILLEKMFVFMISKRFQGWRLKHKD